MELLQAHSKRRPTIKDKSAPWSYPCQLKQTPQTSHRSHKSRSPTLQATTIRARGQAAHPAPLGIQHLGLLLNPKLDSSESQVGCGPKRNCISASPCLCQPKRVSSSPTEGEKKSSSSSNSSSVLVLNY